jgi:hypothetical protein
MQAIQMDVSKKVNGKFAKQGEVTITVPTLADVIAFVTSPIKKDEKGVEIVEDGLPVYEDDKANWVQSAILAAVKAQARNKLVSGTATLKEGNTIPTDWDGLLAEGVRGGGEALAIAREAKNLFAEWMAKQGKSEAATNAVVGLFSNRQALALQSATNKGKVKAYVESFAESLDEAALERITKPVEAVLAACEDTAEVEF